MGLGYVLFLCVASECHLFGQRGGGILNKHNKSLIRLNVAFVGSIIPECCNKVV